MFNLINLNKINFGGRKIMREQIKEDTLLILWTNQLRKTYKKFSYEKMWESCNPVYQVIPEHF